MPIQILDAMEAEGFEELIALCEPSLGLRAFVGIHSTSPGPAFGGTRRFGYTGEQQALRDCLRLARAMTLKCALARVEAGGGKVVILDSSSLVLEEAYGYLGEYIESMGGRFYTGPDVGTDERALAWLSARTQYVTRPGKDGPGQLADATSAGVLAGIAAALEHLDGDADWERRTAVVQGLGEVGRRVARGLLERGVRVLAAEIEPARARSVRREIGVELLERSREYDPPCDVFVPCALGGILHDVTLQRLKCRVIAGGANNMLAREEHGDRLHERGILYVPDFAINSGALIRGATFHMKGERLPVETIARRIGTTVRRILDEAAAEGLPPTRYALREAQSWIEESKSGRRKRALPDHADTSL
jgi:leucine dehydrogenase